MIQTGWVKSAVTGQPIAYASVTMHDINGKYMGVGTQANAQGYFSLNSAKFDDPNFDILAFTAVGHKPQYIGWEILDGTPLEIKLQEGAAMTPILVTTNKKNKSWLFLLGLLFLIKK